MAMRQYDTKQLIVPAKYFLSCLAGDLNTTYPVNIFLLCQNGGAGRSVKSGKELKSLCVSKDIYQSSVISAEKTSKGVHIELMKNGRYTVDYSCMPERRHMETLTRTEVIRLYQIVFSTE